MQLTSTFVLAAVLALKATSVVAAPFFSSEEIISVEAREIAPSDIELEAREFDDELELEARDFDDEFELEARDFDDEYELEAREFDDDFELDARDFDDYEELEARVFNPLKAVSAAKKVGKLAGGKTGGHSLSKTKAGGHSLSKAGGRLRTVNKLPVRGHGQSRSGRKAGGRTAHTLGRIGRAGGHSGRPTSGRGRVGAVRRPGGASSTGRTGHTSRFANKIHGEKSEMGSEMKKIHSEEQRLKKQGSEMKLQENIHRDSQLLKQDGAF
ncbi:hypothetical protein BDN70DRAFT_885187 [Pholiota conissans]|uniref:Uncharacterized protein n=1 Tax=Pholiota conissans TaxID=109636 RepID=A0A9P6CVF6_9AGAR|nr:hypothetical protein BDN70DRAFT_885187 [Pholiota conissans]